MAKITRSTQAGAAGAAVRSRGAAVRPTRPVVRAPARDRLDAPAVAPRAADAAVDRVAPIVQSLTADGAAFIEARLVDIAARVAKGEKVRVGFDIDDTLADTRARTLGLLKQWDSDHDSHYFDGLGLDDVKYDAKDTLKGVDLPWDVQIGFLRFWDQRFQQGTNYALDTPIPAIVELAKRAKAAGAEVIYLTGRLHRRSSKTIEELQRFGLTDANEDTVVGKPVNANGRAPETPQFKTEWLKQSAADGYYLAWFITESKRDIAAIQAGIDGAPAVLIDHAFNGPEDVLPDTPVYPRSV